MSVIRPRIRAAGLMSLPLWFWLLVFFVVPVTFVIWYSFGYKPNLYSTHSNAHLSFGRYAEAASATFGGILIRTLKISLVGTLLCLLIGYPVAYWMALQVSSRWRGLIVALILVPYWTNFLVRTIGWQIALAPEGFLSDLLLRAHLINQPLEVLYTTGAVQLGVVYNYLPLMILPLYVTLERLDPSLLEASGDLGQNGWATFWKVTVPLSRPGVVAGSVLVFVPLMGDYVTPAVLGGAKGSMVGQMVAAQFRDGQNWALGSAMAVLLMIAILTATAVVAVVFRVAERAVQAFSSVRVPLQGDH